MIAQAQSAETIFLAALEEATPAKRAALVEKACAGDGELLRRVLELLACHEASDGPLDAPPEGLGAAGDSSPASEQPGCIVGPYKLVEQIGEGGMATVWMAQQTDPVKRLVAVKLIKPGMDTKQVLARFEAERQALALMDHPNIARVLDGGTTAAGRPYFVMDLVKGIPITKYCDEHQLTPQQRLDLFIPVCQAIQHAHQKGIIHRDLKPTNVLVALYDGKPVPKVIDFGVAKATGHQLTQRTLVTRFGTIVGTLEYMSPEQASFNQLDVDTRSDIYSLGVLLYELLTGSPPHGKRETEADGLIETLRAIREQVPTLPSTKLSTADSTLAAYRGTEPAKLTKLVRGELDWIVMKALEKDRNRRYETANGLATDLQNYLADEPVQACPPSASYRLRRFVRRNKGAVAAIAALFLLLVAGILGTSWGLVRAEHAWEAEGRQRKLAEAAVVAERVAKEAEAKQRTLATEAARQATKEAAVAAAINDFLNRDILLLSNAMGQMGSGVTPDANLSLRTVLQRAARRMDGKFPGEPEVEMRLRYTIGASLSFLGDNTSALPQIEKVVALSHQLLDRNDLFTLNAEYRLAGIHRALGHSALAVRLAQENLERRKAAFGETNHQTMRGMNGLALAYQSDKQLDKALQIAQQHLELRKRHSGPRNEDTWVSMNNVAWLYQEQKKWDKAVPLFEEALAGMRSHLGPLHPERLNTTANLARAYYHTEQLDKAIVLEEPVLPQYKTVYGVDDARTLSVFNSLLTYYTDAGSSAKAEALLNSTRIGGAYHRPNAIPAQDQREKRYRELLQRLKPAADRYHQELSAKKADDPATLAARQAFGVALRNQKRTTGAAYQLQAVLDVRQRLLGANHPDTRATCLELAMARFLQGHINKALALFHQANPEMQVRATRACSLMLAVGLQRLGELSEDWCKSDKSERSRRELDEEKKQ